MRLGLWSTWLATFTVGCTYITSGKLNDKLDAIDEDHDGESAKTDCDDQDDRQSKLLPEQPYDGIDNDCSLEEGVTIESADVDADGDGFPKITQAEYEALDPELEYPPGLASKEIDCDDTNALVYPSEDADSPYDGVDANCDGKNDYDQDGDGYFANLDGDGNVIDQSLVDAFVAAYGFDAEHVAAWGPGGVGGPQPGDCEDATGSSTIHPGLTEDVPYSGIDENCDGADDFDQDDDGFVPPGMGQRWQDFQQRYFRPDAVKPETDCADGPDVPDVSAGFPFRPLLPIAVAKDVHPGATEIYGDGLDSDCAGDDDFDQDVDHYIADTDVAALAEYIDTWGFEDATWAPLDQPGDCDDLNPNFHPGVLDVLWNGEDEDCDALVDASLWNFGDGGGTVSADVCPLGNAQGSVCWLGPSEPEFLWFAESQFLLFGAAQEFWDTASLPEQHEKLAGAMVSFDSDAAIGPGVPDELDGRDWMRVFLANAPEVFSPYLDLARDATPGEVPCTVSPNVGDVCNWLSVAGRADNSADSAGEINAALLFQNNGLYQAQPQTRGLSVEQMLTINDGDTASGFDAGADIGIVLQCSDERLHGKKTTGVTSYVSSDADNFGGDVCFFHDQVAADGEPQVEVCNGGVCFLLEFLTDPVGGNRFVKLNDLPAESWIWGDREDGWTLLVSPSHDAYLRADGDSTLVPVFVGHAMESFDLDVRNGVSYLAGVTTTHEIVVQAIDGVTVNEQTLDATDPSNPTFEPWAVAIAASDDRIGIAITSIDPTSPPDAQRGVIGWTFLGTE